MIPFETTRHKPVRHIVYRRLAKRFPSALMPFVPCSGVLASSARCMPRTATPAHRVIPVRNRANIISVSTLIGPPPFSCCSQILMATIVPDHILFLLSNKRRESVDYSPSRVHFDRTTGNERVDLSAHAEITTRVKRGDFIVANS